MSTCPHRAASYPGSLLSDAWFVCPDCPAGLVRLLAGLVFPIALLLVVVMGAELFTGECPFENTPSLNRVTPHFLLSLSPGNTMYLFCALLERKCVHSQSCFILRPVLSCCCVLRVLQSEALGSRPELGVELHRQLLGMCRMCVLSRVPGGVDDTRSLALLHHPGFG